MELNAVGRAVDRTQAVPGMRRVRKRVLDQPYGHYAQLHVIGIRVDLKEAIRFRPLPANRGYTL
jgi:hypothetical protein